MREREELSLSVLNAAISGDRAAVTAIVKAYMPRVYGLCLRIAGDSHLAEDATQECFIRALRALPQLRDATLFRSWLLMIAANSTKDLLKAKKRAPLHSADLLHQAVTGRTERRPHHREEPGHSTRTARTRDRRPPAVCFTLGRRGRSEAAGKARQPISHCDEVEDPPNPCKSSRAREVPFRTRRKRMSLDPIEAEELALYLEGAVEGARLAEIEEALASDALLQTRLEALEEMLPRAFPTASAHPDGLLERVMGNLEREGLVEDSSSQSVALPAGLERRTLEVLEREGLIASNSALDWMKTAALILVSLGLLGGAYWFGGQNRTEQVVYREVPVVREVERRVEVPVPVEVEKVVKVEVPVEVVRTIEIEVPVESERVVEKLVEVPGPTETIVKVVEKGASRVDHARGVEFWNSATGEWTRFQDGQALDAGTLLRGVGARAEVTIDGARLRVPPMQFVWSSRRSLTAIPTAAGVQPAEAPSVLASQNLGLAQEFVSLMELLGKGSSHEQNLAQLQLERLKSRVEATDRKEGGVLLNLTSSRRPSSTSEWLTWFEQHRSAFQTGLSAMQKL